MMKRILLFLGDSLIIGSILLVVLTLIVGQVGRGGLLLGFGVGVFVNLVFEIAGFLIDCYGASFPEEAS